MVNHQRRRSGFHLPTWSHSCLCLASSMARGHQSTPVCIKGGGDLFRAVPETNGWGWSLPFFWPPVPYHLKFEASDPVPYHFLPCIFHEPSTLCRLFFRAHPSLCLFPKESSINYEAGGPGAASIQKLSQLSRITLIRPLWWSMMMNVKEKI